MSKRYLCARTKCSMVREEVERLKLDNGRMRAALNTLNKADKVEKAERDALVQRLRDMTKQRDDLYRCLPRSHSRDGLMSCEEWQRLNNGGMADVLR